MQGLSILLLAVGVIIIIINIMINLGNIIRISMFCIQTNTLNQYWGAWFKAGVNGRAIISSIIGFVIALMIFFIIVPIVLIRRTLLNKKVKEYLANGLFFDYSNIKVTPKENATFFTNINKLGIDSKDVKITGDIKIDVLMILGTLTEKCKEKGIKIAYKIMEDVKLKNSQIAKIPVLLEMNNQKYPIYLIYNDEQKDQFYKVGSQLEQSGYKDCLYFSVNQF